MRHELFGKGLKVKGEGLSILVDRACECFLSHISNLTSQIFISRLTSHVSNLSQ